jgi:hypothetical protein
LDDRHTTCDEPPAATWSGPAEGLTMKLTGHKTRSMFERFNIVSDNDLASAALRLGGEFAAPRRQTTLSIDVSPMPRAPIKIS